MGKLLRDKVYYRETGFFIKNYGGKGGVKDPRGGKGG